MTFLADNRNVGESLLKPIANDMVGGKVCLRERAVIAFSDSLFRLKMRIDRKDSLAGLQRCLPGNIQIVAKVL